MMTTYLIVGALLVFSALFSGLNLGIMSLSPTELKRKASLGDEQAAKVYKIRKKGNLLLTTILIGNVAINAALSIFLGSVTSGFAAGIIATALIVTLGEITPQAIFSRYALSLSAKLSWLIRTFIIILYPISWPIAFILNKTLGDELPNVYSKQELMKIIEEHEDIEESDVDEDEERIIKGALTFSDKKVSDVMTPRIVTKTLDSKLVIDAELLQEISESGHSRIPVFNDQPDNIVGILYVRRLIGDKNTGKKVGDVADTEISFVEEEQRLDATFNAFLRVRRHLFIATDEFGGMVGVITLEDILEEIIKSEIVDEGDKHRDMRKLAKDTSSDNLKNLVS